MVYKVILSDFAKLQLDDILFYISMTLGNETAARSVLQDAEDMLYTLEGGEAHIDRIYHELEDYKNLPD